MVITIEGVAIVLGITLTICTLVGVWVRALLIPYLRVHLVQPVAEVRDQVANTHKTNLRADLDGMRNDIRELKKSQDRAKHQAAKEWAEHRAYSETVAIRLGKVEHRLEELRLK